MSNVKNVAEEYSARLIEKMNNNNDKIFLVDYSKSCSVQRLSEILSPQDGQFFLVENRRIAKDILSILEPLLGEFTLIDSKETLESWLQAGDSNFKSTQAEFISSAKELRKNTPRVMFTFRDENTGDDLLHAVLCKDETRNGVYEGELNRGAFCVSDLLSICAYESVVIDDVYKYFEFEKENIYADKKFICGEYERIDFLGEAHYIHQSYSYRRLKNIVIEAKKCILISDVIANSSAVELYAALNMLHDSFSHRAMKEKVERMTNYYDADCDELLSNLSFVETERSVLSKCLGGSKNERQKVPGDMETLSMYLKENFRYMSEEERFLRAVAATLESVFQGKRVNMEKLLDTLDMDKQSMVDAIKQMFFSDKLKGELESVLVHSRLNQMSSMEVKAMFKVFLNYGVVHCYDDLLDKVKIMRFKRDNCGFEHFVFDGLEKDKCRPDDEYTYSIVRDGSASLYKSIALRKMIDGSERNCSANAPILVVVNSDVNEVIQASKKILKNYEYITDIRELAKKTNNTIAVVTYQDFLETPLWLHFGTTIFFDILPSGIGMRNAVEKALRYGDAKAYIFAEYSNLSGHFVDEWQDLLLSKGKMLPINGEQVNLKESKEPEYCKVLQDLDKMYQLLRELMVCGGKNCAEQSLKWYNHLITEYTLRVRPRQGIMQRDFAYLASLTKEYQAIFNNSITVGNSGEQIFSETRSYVKLIKDDKKKKKKLEEIVERMETKENRYVFFNACASMLFRNCDWRFKNCNGCEGYEELGVNNFNEFKGNIKLLFQHTKKFIQEVEKYEWIRSSGELIQGGSSEEGKDRLVMSEIEMFEESADAILEKLQAKSKKKTLFWAEYTDVEELQRIVQNVYCKIFQKYYFTVMEIFNIATEKAKESFCRLHCGIEEDVWH